jgi:DAK2 domain fusion protein YloV
MSSDVDPDGGGAPAVLAVLDAAAVRRWSVEAVAALSARRAQIDGLNVFPVADRDTGTNLVTTLRAAHDALAADPADTASAALHALAVGAALGARGNSGAIMSQVLRGLSESVLDGSVDGPVLATGLNRGAALARSAVVEPVEGTILTVAVAAAESAVEAGSLAEVITAAVAAAVRALQRTPEQLAALADTGMVDAGALGLVVLLDALARVITGHGVADVVGAPTTYPSADAACSTGHSAFGFEVQYLLDARSEVISPLREMLASRGDSVVVAGTGEGTWNVHVHTDDVGAVIEAGIALGTPRQVKVVALAEQPATPARSGVVAVAPDSGLAHLFEVEGVEVLPANADEAQILSALTSYGGAGVVLLPGRRDASGPADAAARTARGAGVRTVVVPTRSPVQALAAVAVHDPARPFDDDVVAMAEAAAATRHAEIVRAEQDALTSVGACRAGDVLGLIDGDVVQIGHSTMSVAFILLDRLLGVGAELMTFLIGDGMPPNAAAVLTEHARSRSPLTEITVYHLGSAEHALVIGAE